MAYFNTPKWKKYNRNSPRPKVLGLSKDKADRVLISPCSIFYRAEIRSAQLGAEHTIPCHSQPCQFERVHASAAYGYNMLSGELVSWPGLPSPGTDGGSLGPEKQNRTAQDSGPTPSLLPWLFPSARWPLLLTSLRHMPGLLFALVI